MTYDAIKIVSMNDGHEKARIEVHLTKYEVRILTEMASRIKRSRKKMMELLIKKYIQNAIDHQQN